MSRRAQSAGQLRLRNRLKAHGGRRNIGASRFYVPDDYIPPEREPESEYEPQTLWAVERQKPDTRWRSVKDAQETPILFESSEEAGLFIEFEIATKHHHLFRVTLADDWTQTHGKIFEIGLTTNVEEYKVNEIKHVPMVEVFSDLETRKFAIASRCESEAEFLVECSKAIRGEISAKGSETVDVLLVECLPLIVDICCKYRGYKAERVQSRMMFIAGDLEMPSLHESALKSFEEAATNTP